MRTTGLLLALIAMVALVSSGQARPSAESSAAADIRDLGDSIEQIHPAPFRSISNRRFEAEVEALAARAPTISRDELLVGVLRIIASLGPRNGHTGLFPGDPGDWDPFGFAVFGAVAHAVGAIAAMEAIKRLSGYGEPSRRMTTLSMSDYRSGSYPLRPMAGCPTCGG